MNVNWFKNQDHLVYINGEKDLPALEKQLKLPGLAAAAKEFRAAPTEEGLQVKGQKRSTAKLFLPDLTFQEHIEMGENTFLYMGEMSECYVIFYSENVPAQACTHSKV